MPRIAKCFSCFDSGVWVDAMGTTEYACTNCAAGAAWREAKKAKKPEMVKDPAHYTKLNPEPIDVMEAWNLPFHLTQALKYIARAGSKEGNTEEQDLRKAIRYLSRRINQLKGVKSWELAE